MVRLIKGGSVNDILDGTSGIDNIFGGAGNDGLRGFDGNDILFGEAGNDTLVGGLGNDMMVGGTGNDLYVVDRAQDMLLEEVNGGTADQVKVVDSLTSFTLGANFEILSYAGTGDFNGWGNALDNIITGGNGNDDLHGHDGNDVIDGGNGNDWLFGDAGSDTLLGGGSHDLLIASEGDDHLEGGAGRDQLIGDSGNDTMWGGSEKDYLVGGSGQDEMWGGEGTDTFAFSYVAHSTFAAPDVIKDFEIGIDHIELHRIDANEQLVEYADAAKQFEAYQAFTFASGGARALDPTTHMAIGTLLILDKADGTHIYGEVNGEAQADLHIFVEGVHGMTASDFIL